MIEILLSVLTQLGLYALLALSLSLIFGASRVVNLATGDFAAVGAYAMVATQGLPFALRIVVSLVAAAPVLFLIERGLLSRLLAHPLASMLVTWGVGMALRQACEVIWGSTARSVAAPVEGSIEILGTVYPTYRLIAALVGVGVTAVVLVLCYRTRAGLRLRAVAENPTMSALLGTNPARARSIAFIVAGMLAMLAGALYSPLLGVSPSMGFSLLIPSFFALLLARPGSFAGAAGAAVVIVTLQVLLRQYFPDTTAEALFYGMVLIAVAIRSIPITRRFQSWLVRIAPSRKPRKLAA
ncbi:branched-chain amino acid ABC transporter permease [Citricoccus sp. GCM10030269]|uniref:branched-chain amino acid ABC transporter permease n=1 Tax=Citricoccus sp. GCM10030269 TaxID=3273388 RepID=UPI003607EE2C